MVELLLTLLCTFLIVSAVVAVLLRVRTPRYRLGRAEVITLLQMVITGQATDNDWSVFTGIPIRHDERLEQIRLRCIEIEAQCYTGSARPPYLFSAEGIEALRILLADLSADSKKENSE